MAQEQDEINVLALVRKLIGPVSPVGETHADAKRLANLKKMIDLAEELNTQICDVMEYENSHRWSEKEAGQCAAKYIRTLARDLVEDALGLEMPSARAPQEQGEEG